MERFLKVELHVFLNNKFRVHRFGQSEENILRLEHFCKFFSNFSAEFFYNKNHGLHPFL